MSEKPITKIKIDNTIYKQIRKENKIGESIWWKNKPELSEGIYGSGLHVINDCRTNNHYDFYNGKEEIKTKREKTCPEIGGVFNNNNGTFVIPPNMIWIKNADIPTFISNEEYQNNREKYQNLKFINIKDYIKK